MNGWYQYACACLTCDATADAERCQHELLTGALVSLMSSNISCVGYRQRAVLVSNQSGVLA